MEIKTKNKFEEFELFLTKEYNSGRMNAKQYSQINIIIGEFENSQLHSNTKSEGKN